MMSTKKVFFATSSRHKFEEVKEIFSKFSIELEQAGLKPEEDKTKTIQEIAKESAKAAAEKIKKPVIVDDTGIFFIALDNFPGNSPNQVFKEIGYDGLFNALEGKTKDAYFETAAAYCEPGKEPVVFTERMYGKITKEVFGINRDVMPYERIFIPEGYDEVIAFMPGVKKKISHRVKAFTELAKYIAGKG